MERPFLYLGQHYVAAYIVFPGLGPERNYSAFVNTVMNLNDKTALVRADFRASLYRNLSLALSLSHYVGDSGEFRFAFEVPPVPGVDGLEDGIRVEQPPGFLRLPFKWASDLSRERLDSSRSVH